jgi:hypothetical protein
MSTKDFIVAASKAYGDAVLSNEPQIQERSSLLCRKLFMAGVCQGELMRRNRPVLFRGRHFEDQIIVLCVCWSLSYSLSYRDLEQIMFGAGPRCGSLQADDVGLAKTIEAGSILTELLIRRRVRRS